MRALASSTGLHGSAWIEQMLWVVDARNRFASTDDRRRVESLFRRAQDEYRKRAGAG